MSRGKIAVKKQTSKGHVQTYWVNPEENEQDISKLGNPLDDIQGDVDEESDVSDARVRKNGAIDFSHLKSGERIKAMQEELAEGMNNLAEDKEVMDKYLDFLRTGYNYSFRNQQLLLAQKPEGSIFKTYKQWAALGYQVRKGAKSASILRINSRKVDAEDKDGNPIIGDDGKTKKVERFAGYSSYSVFSERDLDPSVKEPPRDTLSEHIERYRNNPSISDNEAMKEDLLSVAQSMNIPVTTLSPEEHPTLASGAGGFARRNGDGYEIVISSQFQPHSQTYTLAHELGHIVCGHLDDDEERDYASHRGDIEVEAETVAYAIARDYGLDTGERAFSYVSGWSQKDESTLEKGFSKVSKGLAKYYESLEKMATGTTQAEINAQANTANREKSAQRKKSKK